MEDKSIAETDTSKNGRSDGQKTSTFHTFMMRKREHAVDIKPTCSKRVKICAADTRYQAASGDGGSAQAEQGGETRPEEKRVEEYQPSLDTLPDDVLLIILSYLDHPSLFRLCGTCELFARLCQDYTLWRNVEFAVFTTPAHLDMVYYNVHKETKSIHMFGGNYTLPRAWLISLSVNCPELEKLSLPYHLIDCRLILISDFPTTLTRLDLSHTSLLELPIDSSYFRDISLLIPNLKQLILSNCSWFDPHSLMAISKCKNLEELRLNDCDKVTECLAYCGLSVRNGFPKLKTLDLRRCPLSNSELACFFSIAALRNLYLEMPQHNNSATEGLLLLGSEPKLEKLVIRHFDRFQDATLIVLASDAQYLSYLDVTGSRFSQQAIDRFKLLRPNVQVVNDLPEHNF